VTIRNKLFLNVRSSTVTLHIEIQQATVLSSIMMSLIIGVEIESKKGIMYLLVNTLCQTALSWPGLKRLKFL